MTTIKNNEMKVECSYCKIQIVVPPGPFPVPPICCSKKECQDKRVQQIRREVG